MLYQGQCVPRTKVAPRDAVTLKARMASTYARVIHPRHSFLRAASQAVPRTVMLPFCLAILLRDKASDGRPLRLVAATAALLFPEQEAVFKVSPSIQVPLAVADAEGASVPWLHGTHAKQGDVSASKRRALRLVVATVMKVLFKGGHLQCVALYPGAVRHGGC